MALTAKELDELVQRLGLSAPAQAILAVIRSSPPTRRVRSVAGNVSVRYPSRKMGQVIQAESHRNELAGIYEKEHDLGTLEYYDQPPPIKLVYQARSGRRVGVWHTPDFFVIRRDAVGWEEWKTEEDLLRLTEEMPHRYHGSEDGHWRCPPGEAYAQPLGFFYRVCSSAEIDWVFQRNMLFLEDYLRSDCPPVGPAAAASILSLVAARPGISLADLRQCAPGVNSDDIHVLIASEQVYVNMRTAPLAEPQRVLLFRDEVTAQAYQMTMETAARAAIGEAWPLHLAAGVSMDWDGRCWTLLNVGQSTMALLAEDGTLVQLPHMAFETLVKQGKLTCLPDQLPGHHVQVQELLARASPDDLQEANRRYAIIAPRLSGQPAAAATTPARTIRDWLARWRAAEQAYGCGYVGLLPRRWASGNRQRKLPAETLAALEAFITNDYETLKQKSRFEVYGALLRACEQQGIVAPSYKTFAQAVERRPRHTQVEKRQGRRAAYQHQPFYWELALTTPRHGDRPFEIGHIDHTQLDIEILCSQTNRPLGKPWATFLSDAFSRRLLAVTLAFDPPSYRACMMILRECVRRHGRLPQTIVVDGGPEFQSTYFETLLARYECTKKTRPAAQPRFGSVCERLFGTTNTRFIYNLLGNTQLLRQTRQVTKSVTPQAQACWPLDRLYVRLCEWAYEVYDTIDHPALGQSPREAFAVGLAQGGYRTHRLIPYDEAFQMLTLPTTRKGTAKVQPRLGLKIHYIHYWCDAFLDPEVEKSQVPVRFDPFDAGVAYAFVKGRWVRCISEYYPCFAGRSQRELMLATAELRRRQQRHQQQLPITARQLADFLASLEAEELLLIQRLQDVEAKAALTAITDTQTADTDGCDGSHIIYNVGATDTTSLPSGEAAGDENPLVIYEDY